MPEDQAEYVAGWIRLLPEYEIKLWDENNYNVYKIPYTSEAYKAKKYAFVSDYARFYILYQYGGIFFDTDVELLKPFNDVMLGNKCFSGFESEKYVAPGLIFASEKGSVIVKELLDYYKKNNFIKENGDLNLTPSPQIFTNILLKYGLKQNNTYQELGVFTAYPSEYFNPMSFQTGKINITNNTYSIHHYAMSWYSDMERLFVNRSRTIRKTFGNNIISRIIEFMLNLFTRIKRTGLKKTIFYYKYMLQKNYKKVGIDNYAQ
jgi:mannosyltransferase OCH1-like enzyme